MLASIYLHDIGMSTHRQVLENVNDDRVQRFINDAGMWDKDLPRNVPTEVLTIVRNKHSKTTMEYIRKHGERLGINDGFSRYIISLICGLHTEKWLPSEYLSTLETLERSNNILILAALLRLGDILHSDYSRIEYERFHIIEVFPSLPTTSWNHWAKHLLLQKVLPKPTEGVIELLFAKPSTIKEIAWFSMTL